MIRTILTISLLFLLVCCKDKKDIQPLPEVAGIFGKWQLTEREYTRGDSTIVEPVSSGQSRVIAFRHDGIMLNEAGQSTCCAPASYLLNGVLFEIKTVGEPPAINPQCQLVDCIACAQLKITQQADSLTIESCPGGKSKYIRN